MAPLLRNNEDGLQLPLADATNDDFPLSETLCVRVLPKKPSRIVGRHPIGSRTKAVATSSSLGGRERGKGPDKGHPYDQLYGEYNCLSTVSSGLRWVTVHCKVE
uniref:Uncharacterized protein n=1 Tax=Oryza sativa subsp. japonica TaxID=39947 RepID=Q6YZC8_ORYSJ|nr:hypothetical protein [Oryza sativa Japonica Group]